MFLLLDELWSGRRISFWSYFSPSTLRILAGAFNQTAQDQEQTLDVQTIFVISPCVIKIWKPLVPKISESLKMFVINTSLLILAFFFKHPDYDPNVFNIPNDVAVAQLTSEADLDNEFIGLMTLPRSDDVFANNTNCWATGWGRYGNPWYYIFIWIKLHSPHITKVSLSAH